MKILTASEYYKKRFGSKVYRLSLSAGRTCPNRDGTCGTGGCIFCSAGGSGDFAEWDEDVLVQIQKAKFRVESKFPKQIDGSKRLYIAYFQSFTNTYGPLQKLRETFTKAAMQEEICALSIATRPDCLGPDVIQMLREINSIKPVAVELGLQTIHPNSALKINRGYDLSVFQEAYAELKKNDIEVIVHVILGLPFETEQQMLETVKYLASMNPRLDGIKLQLLQVLDGTVLGDEYRRNPFKIYTLEEYGELLVKCLELLPPETVVHRITGDGPKKILIEPKWCGDKKRVINYLNSIITKHTISCVN